MSPEPGRIVLLDGGMGQELRRRSARPATPLWSAQVMLDEPQLVTAVHRDFIDAGARVITTNNYTVTPQRLARDGDPALFEPLQATALHAAQQARAESGQAVRIAGCLPPLVASYHAEVVPDAATCLRDYRRLAQAQAAGVDLLLCETMTLTHEALAATRAALEQGVPVWVAFTVEDADGTRLRSGEPLRRAARAVVAAGASAVLVNCSAPEAVAAAMDTLADLGVPFGGYANAFTSATDLQPGGTVEGLETRRDLDPEGYAEHACRWVERGATLVGGCCEVSPAHIARLAERLRAQGHSLVSA